MLLRDKSLDVAIKNCARNNSNPRERFWRWFVTTRLLLQGVLHAVNNVVVGAFWLLLGRRPLPQDDHLHLGHLRRRKVASTQLNHRLHT